MMETTVLPMFIADRLRGIPLVSRGSRSEQTALVAETTPVPNANIVNGGGAAQKQLQQKSLTELIGLSAQKGKVAAIRSISDSPAPQQEQFNTEEPGLLVRRPFITAATSNLIVNGGSRTSKFAAASTTTTRRPNQVNGSSGTSQRTRSRTGGGNTGTGTSSLPGKSIRTTTTTTRKPQKKSSASHSMGNTPARSFGSSATTITSTEPTKTITSTITTPTATNSSSRSGSSRNGESAQEARFAELETVTVINGERTVETEVTNLTRTIQSIGEVTAPVSQRRTTQPMLSSRFINRLNAGHSGGGATGSGFAGENWALFNRPDGRFSVFEVLVILSNVMIVGTIVLVILFSWFKSARRKRLLASQLKQQAAMQPQEILTLSSRSPSGQLQIRTLGEGDRESKISMISNAGGLSSNREQAATGSSRNTDGFGQRQGALVSGSNNTAETHLEQRVGSAQNMTSSGEIKGGGGLTNKAMAIVQPTEATAIGSTNSESEKLANAVNRAEALIAHENQRQMPPINCSISDLSAGTRALKPQQAPPSEADRVAALEQLFNEQQAPMTTTGQQRLGKTTTRKGLDTPQKGAQRRMSVSSLESIELPPTLVDSIRRSDPRNPANAEAPSPNLLLGKMAAPERTIVVPAPQLDLGAKGPPVSTNPIAEPSKVSKASSTKELPEESVKQDLKQEAVEGRGEEAKQMAAKSTMNESSGKAAADSINKDAGSEFVKNPTEPAGINHASGASSKTASERAKQPAAELAKTSATTITTMSSTAQQDGEKKQPTSANKQRPSNPVGLDFEAAESDKPKEQPERPNNQQQQAGSSKVATTGGAQQANVKSHQVVVNKLDRRKTNLEIVDLRDDSVTGKMRALNAEQASRTKKMIDEKDDSGLVGNNSTGWISMDGVAVVQPAAQGSAAGGHNRSSHPTTTGSNPSPLGQQSPHHHHNQQQLQQQAAPLSPSEIIESKFHVDYSSRRRHGQQSGKFESLDSKTEEYTLNNIENELELDNKMRNRKYFVYIVHDGHFTAKKECIARIELPPKRRITLAELRQLIANSQDISLSSLRRNRFKFVTETYRLLNENEDAAVLHQVYPTQGVFLKLNIPEQEQAGTYMPYKSRTSRLSSSTAAASGAAVGGIAGTGMGTAQGSSLSQQTIASRSRANVSSVNNRVPGRTKQAGSSAATADDSLPAIEVDYAQGGAHGVGGFDEGDKDYSGGGSAGYGRTRASSVGRRATAANGRGAAGAKTASAAAVAGRPKQQPPGGTYRRSKSSMQSQRNAGANS